ncbi:MAG: carbohydrate kinase family protein [Clostridia bacterium]|nr:carbohydrate kinase family protein [Clostridia bacterium]
MSFIAGAAATNVDLLFENLPRMPEPGEEIYTGSMSLQLGGGLPGTLVNLGRLGVPVRIGTELGSDLFSRFAAEEFARAGAEVVNLGDLSCAGPTDGAGPAPIPVNITAAVILPHDRSFISYGKGGLTRNGRTENGFYSMARGAKICLMDAGGFVGAYKKLKDDGAVMVLDMGWDDELSFEKYSELFALADYYTPNRKEALKLTGKNDPREALLELKKRFGHPLVKLDAEGCIGIDEQGEFFEPSFDEFKNVDSTGAGDAFLAGLCYGLYHGRSFRECVRLGNITGGKAVTAVGALSAYCTEEELLRLNGRS